MKQFFTILLAFCSSLSMAQIGWVSTFESIPLEKSDTFWNGADLSEGFLNGRAFYSNSYNTSWNSWSGFSVSNVHDTTTRGFFNQYASITGGGVNHTEQYGVFHSNGMVSFTEPQDIEGCYVTNGTYAALSMRDGDDFAKKFGGDNGDDEDYFRIIARGYQGTQIIQDTFYLADYRDADNSKDFIVTDWTYFSLKGLGTVDSIRFMLESSDTSQHGMNTPGYFCLDNFNADPLMQTYAIADMDFEMLVDDDSFENGANYDGGFEINNSIFTNSYNADWNSWTGWALSTKSDTVTADFTNQFSSIVGEGADESKGYLSGFKRASILFPHVSDVHFHQLVRRLYYCEISNATYAYKVMKDGNQFAKKFGGDSGDDKDYLVLKAQTTRYDGTHSDTLEFYLADFRFDDNSQDYILDQWQLFDLTSILENQAAVRLDFWVEGTDTAGGFGLNTPGYFCMDNLFPLTGSVKNETLVRVNVFPNPVSDRLFLDTDPEIKEVKIVDLTGRTHSVLIGDRRFVDTKHLVPGIYSLAIETEKGSVATKFVKN